MADRERLWTVAFVGLNCTSSAAFGAIGGWSVVIVFALLTFVVGVVAASQPQKEKS